MKTEKIITDTTVEFIFSSEAEKGERFNNPFRIRMYAMVSPSSLSFGDVDVNCVVDKLHGQEEFFLSDIHILEERLACIQAAMDNVEEFKAAVRKAELDYQWKRKERADAL